MNVLVLLVPGCLWINFNYFLGLRILRCLTEIRADVVECQLVDKKADDCFELGEGSPDFIIKLEHHVEFKQLIGLKRRNSFNESEQLLPFQPGDKLFLLLEG